MGLFRKKELPEISDEMIIECWQKLATNILLNELYLCKIGTIKAMLKGKETVYDLDNLNEEFEDYISLYVSQITDEVDLQKIIEKEATDTFGKLYNNRFEVEEN